MECWKNNKAAISVSAADSRAAEDLVEHLQASDADAVVSMEQNGQVRLIEIAVPESRIDPHKNGDWLKATVEGGVEKIMPKLNGYDAVYATYWTEFGFAPEENPQAEVDE